MTETTTSRPITYDHLVSKKKAVRKSVLIPMDQSLADDEAASRAKVEMLRLRNRARPDDHEVAKELAAAEESWEILSQQLQDSSINFVFKSLGRKKYDKLIEEHPPTDDEVALVKKTDPKGSLGWSPATFPDALICACLEEPDLTTDEMTKLINSDEWNTAEVVSMFEAAMESNTTRRIVQAGKGSRGTNGSS